MRKKGCGGNSSNGDYNAFNIKMVYILSQDRVFTGLFKLGEQFFQF